VGTKGEIVEKNESRPLVSTNTLADSVVHADSEFAPYSVWNITVEERTGSHYTKSAAISIPSVVVTRGKSMGHEYCLVYC
jgi:hypothetical protein